MDREISKEVRRKEQRKQIIKIGGGVGAAVAVIAVIISFLQTSLNRKDLTISTVDQGVIEVSVSASGKVIPAFEEIINSPINTRIVEIYKKGGDSVDVGTPILKLDLQSAETEYKKKLDEQQMKQLELEKLRVTGHSKLSEMEMNLKVSRMELDRKAVELRNERYLDSLGAGTTDKVRQVELDYNVSRTGPCRSRPESEGTRTQHLPQKPRRNQAHARRCPGPLPPQGDPDLREQRDRCSGKRRHQDRHRLRPLTFQDRR